MLVSMVSDFGSSGSGSSSRGFTLTRTPGAFFGTTFGPLFFQTYPELLPAPFAPPPAEPADPPAGPSSSTSTPEPPPEGTIHNPNPHGGTKAPLTHIYQPKIYGFKVSERARSGPRMQWLRQRPGTAEELDLVDNEGRWKNGADGRMDEDQYMPESARTKGTLFDDEDEELEDDEEEEEEEDEAAVSKPSGSTVQGGLGLATGLPTGGQKSTTAVPGRSPSLSVKAGTPHAR